MDCLVAVIISERNSKSHWTTCNLSTLHRYDSPLAAVQSASRSGSRLGLTYSGLSIPLVDMFLPQAPKRSLQLGDSGRVQTSCLC